MMYSAHDKQIQFFGGSFGLRDKGLLASAVAMPQASFDGKYIHDTLYLMAASYLFHICKNHPFVDGNKRTAFVTMDVFLRVNACRFSAHEKDLENLVLGTATGKLSKEDIAKFLETHIKK